jgi:hypothetical protein
MDWLFTCKFTWKHGYWAHAEFYHLGTLKMSFEICFLTNGFWFRGQQINTFQSVAMWWASKDFPQKLGKLEVGGLNIEIKEFHPFFVTSQLRLLHLF